MLHDAGFKLAETQRKMTPMQKFVYAKARSYWQEKDAPDVKDPSMAKAQRALR